MSTDSPLSLDDYNIHISTDYTEALNIYHRDIPLSLELEKELKKLENHWKDILIIKFCAPLELDLAIIQLMTYHLNGTCMKGYDKHDFEECITTYYSAWEKELVYKFCADNNFNLNNLPLYDWSNLANLSSKRFYLISTNLNIDDLPPLKEMENQEEQY